MNPPDPDTDMDVRLERLFSANRMARQNWASPEARIRLSGVYAKLTRIAQERFGGQCHGKLVGHCGMDLSGAAWSLASGWLGGAFLGIDASAESIKRQVRAGSCDYLVTDLSEAIRILRGAVATRQPVSVGLAADPAGTLDAMARLGVVPDLLIREDVPHAGACQEIERLGSLVLPE